jgi:CheY-like chemotaxis protein
VVDAARKLSRVPGATDDPSAPDLAGVRILVVDDNYDARRVLGMLFTHFGASVLVADSGEDALEKFHRARPHVVVTDIAMPQWSGYQLLRAIRSLGPDLGGRTPVAAVTAFRDVHHEARVRGAGFDAWLTKPVDTWHLVSVVEGLARSTRES